MVEKMPEKTQAFLEAECLAIAKPQLGCGDLEAVRIRRLHPTGSGPNWEVAEFNPPLQRVAEMNALKAIAPLTGTYALI